VLGVPASLQARGPTRARWKAAVAAAARTAWPVGEGPLQRKLLIHITCFHDSAPPLDVDNMLKPIQGALIGIVYLDDGQLMETHGYLRDVNEPYVVRGMTSAQADGFVSNQPFVHVRVELPPSTARLP
jgi:crossover junction endodeoxyribonuclease RusA